MSFLARFLRAWRDASALAEARDETANLAADLYSSLKERDRLRQSLEVAETEIAELRSFLAAVGWTEAK